MFIYNYLNILCLEFMLGLMVFWLYRVFIYWNVMYKFKIYDMREFVNGSIKWKNCKKKSLKSDINVKYDFL